MNLVTNGYDISSVNLGSSSNRRISIITCICQLLSCWWHLSPSFVIVGDSFQFLTENKISLRSVPRNYSSSNMNEENLTSEYLDSIMMEESGYEERRELKLSGSTKKPEKYSVQTINSIKANIRDVALEDLVELVKMPTKVPSSELQEMSPEQKAAIAKAKFEIHRRAFKNFTVVPSRKFNGAELGTLRKPKQ